MRRVLIGLIALSALALIAQRACVALASQATRIRWRLEEMESGFNEASLGACLRGVDEAWRDAESGIGRAELADGLRALFLQEVDPETKRFRCRVELERESLDVQIDPQDERRAKVVLLARFELLERDAWTPTWRARISADLARDEERGWRAVRSSHETLESDGRLVRAGRP
jgi:hypothetical protein